MLDAANDACRLCFSEADELPGLVIDKYGEIVILQFLDQRPARRGRSEDLRARASRGAHARGNFRAPRSAHSRVGGPSRAQSRSAVACQSRASARPRSFTSTASSFITTPTPAKRPERFSTSAPTTPLRRWARRLGSTKRFQGRALDVCCYQGGFALHLAQVCRQVTGIDASAPRWKWRSAISKPIAPHIAAEVDWIEADAFEILRDWSQAGEHSTSSSSIRPPSPKPNAPSKARCAATRN